MNALNIINAMTVDVEDYFHVSAFEGTISRDDWSTLACRVEGNTHRILDLFDENNTTATFFVLGWVAERYPTLVRSIVERGHELASHGFSHVRVTMQTPDKFRNDITRTKQLLEDLAGVRVVGYRAPSYSIGTSNLWALDELSQAGYEYSSSIYPIKHDIYGMPDAPRHAFYPNGSRGILEVPITTLEIAGRRLPCGGGGFFRLYPYRFSKWAFSRVNINERVPGIFYFHPWEIDPDQPRQTGISLKTRCRHYLHLDRMVSRLQHLLKDFQWSTMADVFLYRVNNGEGKSAGTGAQHAA